MTRPHRLPEPRPGRALRARPSALRWPVLGVAVVVLILFLLAQRQTIEVSYGRSPSSAGIAEGTAGELGDVAVPSAAEMTALVAANPVTRLPGSIAGWDERRVLAAIGGSGYRILVAPPGLDRAERDRVRAVRNATIRVVGTEVTGGAYLASPDTLSGWSAQFASGDVTGPLLTLIAGLQHRASPPDADQRRWREPTGAELATVATDLRANGFHAATGATLTKIPSVSETAFPGSRVLYVALPRQRFGEPLPRYGPALARLFPDTPIVLLYGSWVEYHGPRASRFAEVAGASFYGQFGDRLARYDYPQDNVLGAYLGRVADVRYAGLFDRPLPYRAVDPLRVSLPALPWLFAVCVAFFLFLSARSLPRPARPSGARWDGPGPIDALRPARRRSTNAGPATKNSRSTNAGRGRKTAPGGGLGRKPATDRNTTANQGTTAGRGAPPGRKTTGRGATASGHPTTGSTTGPNQSTGASRDTTAGRKTKIGKPEGRTPKGGKTDGRTPKGGKTEGRTPGSRTPEGRTPDSQKTDGRTPKSRKIEGGRTGSGRDAAAGRGRIPDRLAGLTTLAFEMSALTDERSDPALVRGITALRSAREALAEGLPDRHVRRLLDGAEAELDAAARLLPFAGFRPADYLRDGLA